MLEVIRAPEGRARPGMRMRPKQTTVPAKWKSFRPYIASEIWHSWCGRTGGRPSLNQSMRGTGSKEIGTIRGAAMTRFAARVALGWTILSETAYSCSECGDEFSSGISMRVSHSMVSLGNIQSLSCKCAGFGCWSRHILAPEHLHTTLVELRKIRLSNIGRGLVLGAAFRNHFTAALAAG